MLALNPAPNRVLREAECEQLRPGDHTVLPGGQGSKPLVRRVIAKKGVICARFFDHTPIVPNLV
jgi:hypothetical protein